MKCFNIIENVLLHSVISVMVHLIKQRRRYLFGVVTNHGPHQLLSAVELVLHLEEGQPEDHRHTSVLFTPTRRSAAGSHLLEDEVVDVRQRGSDTLQQQVEGLKRRRLLVIAAGAQRQAEMELKDDR